jgi:hypothetical protein
MRSDWTARPRGRLAHAAVLLVAASATAIFVPSVRAAPVHAANTRHPATSAARLRHRRAAERARARGRRPTARSAILGGSPASIAEAPWQVLVSSETPSGKEFVCGGSLIDLVHVVTAGHCVIDPDTGEDVEPEAIIVLAGTSSFSPETLGKEAGLQERLADTVRIHPGFDFGAGAGSADDVAVIALTSELHESDDVRPIPLAAGEGPPEEGTAVELYGFGEEEPLSEEFDESLNKIRLTTTFSGDCGSAGDSAVLLCASSPSGSGCFGDSGSGVVEQGVVPELLGVMDFIESPREQPCHAGTRDGLVNVLAPEVRSFIEDETPPSAAPRGGSPTLSGVTAVGSAVNCSPGIWTGEPSYSYVFRATPGGLVLQNSPASTLILGESALGRSVLCEVRAANEGGIGVARTSPIGPVEAASKGGQVQESGPQTGNSSLGPPTTGLPTPNTESGSPQAKASTLAISASTLAVHAGVASVRVSC